MLSFMTKKIRQTAWSPVALLLFTVCWEATCLLLLPHPKALVCGFNQDVIAAVFPLARRSASPMSHVNYPFFLIKDSILCPSPSDLPAALKISP